MLGRSLPLLLLALLLAACASDKPPAPTSDAGTQPDSGIDASTTLPSDDAQFLRDYASAVCSMFEPCCRSENLGFDQTGCTDWFSKVTAAYFRGEFRADAAADCLTKLADARSADADRCSQVLDFDEATFREDCRLAFRRSRTGNALGERCLLADDCASADGGDVICSGGTCLLERDGAEGDGPCHLGRSEDVPTEVVRCDARDGLYCHPGDNVCARQAEPGEFCPYVGACKASGLCTGGRCVALPGPGERCVNAIPGAGGFCQAGSSCNPTTLTCGDPLAEGATCREDMQCATRSCMNGKCAKPQFTRALNCTGSD